jgi:hypothetical protein
MIFALIIGEPPCGDFRAPGACRHARVKPEHRAPFVMLGLDPSIDGRTGLEPWGSSPAKPV